jgi:sigma-B regulation protein RsbU (phosphoserine phosphatase)
MPDRLVHALGAEYEAAAGADDDAAAYLAWLAGRQPEGLSGDDDVALRTYMLELRTRGTPRPAMQRTLEALRRLYAWAVQAGHIESSPFDEFNFDRPWLSRDLIRRREQAQGDPRERELQRLRALNRLAEALHRAPDVQATLEAALTTLVEAMGLKSGWVFLQTEAGVRHQAGRAPHDFDVPAVQGLPPALEEDNRYYLRRPPDCHCQAALRRGHLRRAVNVVECTRLLEASGDKEGLLFHATVPLIVHGQPVGLLNFATEEWQFLTGTDLQLLSGVGAHVSLALERARLYEQAEAQRERLAHELAMAREVQASLLPESLPPIPGFGVATEWRAAREMAGDFYDVLALPDGRFGLVIADVADKGAPAALYMAVVHSRVRAAADHAAGPAEALREVNRALYRQAASGMFVTLFYAVLDPATRTLTYCNAGHNPPLLRQRDGKVEALPRGGTALGVLPGPPLTERTLALQPGQALVAYTDGVTEAANAAGDEFGLARLCGCVARAAPAPASVVGAVMAELGTFLGGEPLGDDVTLVVVGCHA